jgi:hypothetical protein
MIAGHRGTLPQPMVDGVAMKHALKPPIHERLQAPEALREPLEMPRQSGWPARMREPCDALSLTHLRRVGRECRATMWHGHAGGTVWGLTCA